MRTKDLEMKLGLSKHTIRYYEKEGLIQPKKDDNGYRNYNEEDIQILELIKFLRDIHISIDDVKAIINGELSFQECLKINKIYLDEQIEELKEVQNKVNMYQQKDIPLIPALMEIKTIDANQGLGFRKTTETISLGRKLTRSLALKQWIITLLISLFFGYGISIGILMYVDISPVICILIICILQQIFIGFNTQASLFFIRDVIDHSMNQSIEFLSDGIRYYKFNGFKDNILYFYSVLLNKQHQLMKYYEYSHIDKVIIISKQRYMKIGTPIASMIDVADFQFIFKDGQEFYFYWPMTLDKDMSYISIILKDKVKNIEDEGHVIC